MNGHDLIVILKEFVGGVGYATIVGIVLAAITKLVPNDKLFNFGYKFGVYLTAIGSMRIGKAWEKIENFFIDSLGQFLFGLKKGLKSDDGNSSNQVGSDKD